VKAVASRPSGTLSLRVAGHLAEVSRVNEAVEQFWQEQHASDANQLDVLLCIEEILSNVIRHGGEGRHTRAIEVEARLTGDEVEIRIVDDGMAFNPLLHATPRIDAPLEARKPGGLGIHLVRNLMDRVHYERRENRNIFTMARRLDGDRTEPGGL
jgi:serine/threonine-protein kinase RsbW